MFHKSNKRNCTLALIAWYCTLTGFLSAVLFIFGIFIGLDVGLFILASATLFISGFVLGIVSIPVVIIRRHEVKGDFIAVLAILLSLPAIIVMGLGVETIRGRRAVIEKYTGIQNLRILYQSIRKYAEANGGYLPKAETWSDQLLAFDKKLNSTSFKHPLAEKHGFTGECQFGFNVNISEMRLEDVPDNVLLLIEADGKWNLSGTTDLVGSRRSKQDGYIVGVLIDGTEVSYIFKENAIRVYSNGGQPGLGKLRWDP